MISTDSNERQKQLEDITKRGLQRVDEKQTRYMLFGRQFILKDQVAEAAKFVQNIKTLIDEAVKASPEASLAWAGVCILLPVLTSPSAAEEASRDGFIYVTSRIRYYMEFEHLLWPDSLHASNMKDNFETQIIDLYQHILEFQIKNVLRFYRNWLANVGRDISGSDDWKGMLTVIKDLELTMIRDWSNLNTVASRKALEAIDEATQQSCTDIQSLLSIARQHIQVSTEHLDVSSKHLKIHERTNQLLEDHPIDLPTVSQARYDSADVQDSPKCESGTRVHIQETIIQWANKDSAEPLFWLSGPAGTGKSTIARTVADVLNSEDRLVAGYFFKRGQQGRNGTARLFSTIAMQMMEKIPSMREHLRRSLSGLDKDAIEGMALEFQFKKLILSPLAELPPDNMPRLASVIILDALDECENEDHLSRIITLFLQLQTLRTIRLRVLLTSRSSPEIRDAFMDLQKDRDFCNIELLDGRFSAETKSDIQTFLENNFADIRKKRRVQQNPWPTKEELDRLVELATTPEPLFIYAATLCRFVHGERRPKNPKEQLRIWLKQCDDRQSQLHQIYEPILNQVFSGLEPAEFDSRLEILGSLVLLVDPMPAASLAALLQMDIDDVVWWLPELHAVLNIPAEDHIPVRLLHKSFSDFILSTERPGNSIYSIDTASTHTTLATKCLGHMNAMLKRDICNVKQLGKRRKDIDQHIVDKHITPDLKYACLYWIYHLQHGEQRMNSEIPTLIYKHLLHWVEVLAILGRLSDAAMAIRRLLEIFQRLPDVPAELVLFTADASRFISSFGSIIDRAPLQIYAASLMFSPTSSKVRQNFWNECLVDIDSIQGVKSDWDVQWQTLEGHSEAITAFAFSPDSQTLASASEDGMIRLWDVTTGTHRQTLKGHSERVTEIFFAPDGRLITTASNDHTIRLWDATTGSLQQTLVGEGSLFTEVNMEDDGLPRIDAVVFSPDGHLAASILTNNTIRIWDTRTGASQQTLKDYNGLVTAVKFSSNNRLIALLLNDGSVQLWDIKGICLQTIKYNIHSSNAVVFSPNSQLITSSVDDGTFYLWEVVTGSYDKVLKDHDAWASTASFSPNGELVAYVTYGGTVRLWNVTKGTHQQELKLPQDITMHVVFSPNGQLVAATGHDIICVWDTVTGVCHQTLKGHSADITGIMFSPNNLLMASISHDETVRLWDITRSTRQQALEGHKDRITAVSISPNAKIIASASVDGTVQLWDATTGAFRQTLDDHGEIAIEVIFSYDSRQLVSLFIDQIRIWDAVTGVHQHALQGHSESMRTMVISPHDKLATRGFDDDNTIQLWDIVTGTHQLALEGHSKPITEAVFSPDGRLLASASNDETVRVWDTFTGTHQQLLKSNGTFVLSIAFSPKSQLAALGFSNSTVQLWDLATGTHQQTFEGYTESILAITFSPDGQVIASALNDGTVCFCDTTTGKIRQTLKTGEVRSLRYDPASKMRLYTDVGTLVMNRTSMEEIADIQGLTPNLVFNGLSFSPDKEWIRIGFEDHVWLPSDYRQSAFGINTSIIRGWMVFIGCQSREILRLRIRQPEQAPTC
ncbi:WD40-repeat-containing domain protein [Trichoderma camerunense]